MKISEIYEKYKIMPQLQEHMLRVTAVASLIAGKFGKKLDKRTIITATLLHDLGNMAKIKLGTFPEFVQLLGVDYWEKVFLRWRSP